MRCNYMEYAGIVMEVYGDPRYIRRSTEHSTECRGGPWNSMVEVRRAPACEIAITL